MSQHFTRDYVATVHTSPASFTPDWTKLKALGVTLYYLPGWATLQQFTDARKNMPRVGVFYTADTQHQYGNVVAQQTSEALGKLAPNDAGQTPVLLDFEPSHGSTQFWLDFIKTYRTLRPGRVTDLTPEPFKATELPVQDLLNAHFDVKVQTYFGDMSPVDAWEAGLDWQNGLNGVGFPPEAIRMFVDGGRVNKPPVFYEGRQVRQLLPGSVIWSCNLLREAGLV